MKFSEDKPGAGLFISGYHEKGISIAGSEYRSSLIICSERVIEHWPPASIDQLHADHITAMLELEPELVLLGTGTRLVFPAVQTYAGLIQKNIGVEIMNTPAACRTYNILMAEGRKVTAGLIID